MLEHVTTSARPTAARTPGRVLVVDDDPIVRLLVTRVLTRVGHTVHEAAHADEASATLAAGGYDVAVVDLEMPVRGGLDLLAELRAVESPVIPILLTGTSDVAAAVEGMKRGAFDYLAKPADPDAIRWAVGRAVDAAHTRRRERALERLAAEWESTFDACPDLLLVLDTDGAIIRANAAVADRVGAGPAELAGRRVTDLFRGPLGAAVAARAAPERNDPRPPMRVFDATLGGHFLLSTNPVRPDGGPPAVVVVARDVTELTRAEEARGKLFRQLLAAQEEERARIARELHDGVGQVLVSLGVGLATVADAPADGAWRDHARRLGRIAAEALDDVRRLSRGLHPVILDDLGLTAALARLTEVFTRVHGVRAELLVPAPPLARLPREQEAAVYRIVQEGLANVAKHAWARTVDVVFEVAGGSVRVSVADDGCGFPAGDRPAAATGLGLSGMRERAEMLGGTFRVDSVPGRGTTIDVRVPIPEGGV